MIRKFAICNCVAIRTADWIASIIQDLHKSVLNDAFLRRTDSHLPRFDPVEKVPRIDFCLGSVPVAKGCVKQRHFDRIGCRQNERLTTFIRSMRHAKRE